ncbi:hypothetical protein NSQ59_24175 [Margalitia sp. FSL K6-0131]|uniref:hypothetical protein n=1 Tax=Margalitia sp. FSL K6-0131 TaxID=2954604 RepID=UPI0030FA8889
MKKKYLVLSLSILTAVIISYFLFDVFETKNKNTSSQATNLSKGSKSSTIIDKNNNIKIKIPSSEIFSYNIYKDIIYMSIDENSKSKLGNKIIQYNIKTKRKSNLFTTKFESSSVQGIKANNNWVTWVDADDYGEQKNIYAMNTNTRKITAITNEHDTTIDNGFPALRDHYLSWIYYDKNKNKSYVMLRDLNKKTNKNIFILETFGPENSRVSFVNNKILFTDQKKGVSYCYIYNISNQTLQTFKVPYENIGMATILNDHQFLYLRFYSDRYFDNKVVLYDIRRKKEKEFSKQYMNVSKLVVDSQNHVLIGTGDKIDFDKYEVADNTINKIGKINENNIFDLQIENGVYMIEKRPRNSNIGTELIISKNLP